MSIKRIAIAGIIAAALTLTACTGTGTPNPTASSTGTPTPTPTTTSGRRDESTRQASSADSGRSASPRTSAVNDLPFNPALRMRSSGSPRAGTARLSRPRAVPTNDTTVAGSRRSSSSATAMPG